MQFILNHSNINTIEVMMKLHNTQNIANVIKRLKLKPKASVAFIFCEDDSLINETIKFHRKREFEYIFLFITEPEQYRIGKNILNFKYLGNSEKDMIEIIDLALPSLIGNWLYWGMNGEFFYYPFCESRTVNDLSDFLMGERRYTISGSVIDLYTGDIENNNDGMSMNNTFFDKVNYYANPAHIPDVEIDDEELQRIKFLYGGLRWRFSEFIPHEKRRIDRVPYFYVDDDLKFSENGVTDRPEFYTYKCSHHYNPTCAIASFHVARYFRHNHDTREQITNFLWDGSQRFRWNSAQLLRMGFIETGQWF